MTEETTMTKEIYHALSDPDYQDSYIDVDEIRSRKRADGSEINFRYIHGGFKGMGVKFSLYYPKYTNYKGRFFQYLSPFPGPDEEMASYNKTGANDMIAFALSNGAYFVESNMGSKGMFDPGMPADTVWKSSAAVAEFSRIKAMEIYKCERPVGIVFGGSGGGYKTMACIENTDAWEGAVPFVIGSPASLPNTITMHAQGQRVLRNVFGKIIDALDAGGSGDMYDGLDKNEAFMLKELTDMGFPPQAWYLEASGQFDDGSLPVLTPGIKMADPGYFEDFWKVPGYLGADPESSAYKDRLVFTGKVVDIHLPGAPEPIEKEAALESRNGVDDAWKKMLADGKDSWIELESLPMGDDLYLKGVNITFLTGAAQGQQLRLGDMQRDVETGGGFITIGPTFGMDDVSGVLSQVKPGDEVCLDNSDYIAIQSYYRHQVPDDLSFHAWDQFRNEHGIPKLPQRANVMGYSMTGTGTVQDGNIQGKVIVVQALMDESTCPWCGDWYRNKVIEATGSEDDFRLYYLQRCMHNDSDDTQNNMVVNYKGALYQSLLDMADWIQKGREPLPSSVYKRVGGQIIEAEDPIERKGIQAGITLTVNGSKCAHVKTEGQFVVRAEIAVPQYAGQVTKVVFDFNDNWGFPDKVDGLFPVIGSFKQKEENGVCTAVSEVIHHFDEPGTYFLSARVSTQRDGNGWDVFTQVKNLDRVRVIVE